MENRITPANIALAIRRACECNPSFLSAIRLQFWQTNIAEQ